MLTRIRRAFRRAAKPAAMALVAGTVALSLTVTTTQKAEATPGVALPVIAAAESIVGGASLPLALPSLLATSIALHPVGWAIGAGVAIAGLSVLAYSTKDQWWPYVSGAFGQGSSNADTPAAAGGNVDPKVTAKTIRPGPSARGMYVDTEETFMNGQASTYFYVSFYMSCKDDTTGAMSTRATSGTSAYGAPSNGPSTTHSFLAQCLAGQSIKGLVAGALNADPKLTSSPGAGYSGGPKNVLRWGDQQSVVNGFDPKGSDVWYKSSSECIDDNGVKRVITAEFAGNDGGAKFPSCAANGGGHGTGVNKIEGYAPTAPGVRGTTPQTVWESTAPAVDPNYAKCDQGRPGPGCEMRITIDGKPCVVGQWECVNWSELWKDSTTAPRVGCTYGPYTLSPDACSIMEPAYRPGGAPLTSENVDGNPSTRNNVGLDGTTYTAPKPQTGTVPGLGGQPDAAMGPDAQNCFPTGWAVLNPVEWVLKPVGCALTAAFVPKTQTVTEAQTRIQNKVNTVGFASVSNAWLGTFNAAGGGSGCSGPTINFSMSGVSQTLQPFQACTEPMRTVAGIANAVSALIIVLFGGLGVVRAIATAFGFNFTLGKGGDTE